MERYAMLNRVVSYFVSAGGCPTTIEEGRAMKFARNVSCRGLLKG
jgi:hypothetical protein